MDQKYRHEFKYPISYYEREILLQRASALMELDKNAGASGKYYISSMYFDTLDDRCFYENEVGIDPREKYRIRLYNNNTGRISLECKRKERGKTLKSSCRISNEDVERIILRRPLNVGRNTSSVLTRFYAKQQNEGLAPKVIVSYERIPYVCNLGNVRITFDSNITSSYDINRFLDGSYSRRAVFDTDTSLLEVKYDEFIPDYIYRALQIDSLTQMAFSKYYLCRKYDMKGIR